MTDPLDRIIWSADVTSGGELDRALDSMPELRIVKIDRLMLTGATLYEIERIMARDVKVFVDAKLVEIPSKLELLAERYCVHKPWMLNCMAGCLSNGNFGGATPDDELDGLKRFADVCHQHDVRPCAVTVLTSKTPLVVRGEFHRELLGQVTWYADRLVEAGFTDVVCSPEEAEHLRSRFSSDQLTINCPGIRPAGSTADDQARTNTPRGAIEAGVDRLVIGRPITNATSRAAMLKHIADEISSVAA